METHKNKPKLSNNSKNYKDLHNPSQNGLHAWFKDQLNTENAKKMSKWLAHIPNLLAQEELKQENGNQDMYPMG